MKVDNILDLLLEASDLEDDVRDRAKRIGDTEMAVTFTGYEARRIANCLRATHELLGDLKVSVDLSEDREGS